MRIASLIGRNAEGKLLSLGVAEGNAIEALCAIRSRIIAGGGIFKTGKDEVQLSEVRLLGNSTAGGELKGAHRFVTPDQVKATEKRLEERRKIVEAAIAKNKAEAAKLAAPAPSRAALLKAGKLNVRITGKTVPVAGK